MGAKAGHTEKPIASRQSKPWGNAETPVARSSRLGGGITEGAPNLASAKVSPLPRSIRGAGAGLYKVVHVFVYLRTTERFPDLTTIRRLGPCAAIYRRCFEALLSLLKLTDFGG